MCQFLQIPCTKEGCEVIIQRRLLEEHHAECEFRLVECKFCGIAQRHKDKKVKFNVYHLKLSFDFSSS